MGALKILWQSIQSEIYEKSSRAFRRGHSVELGEIPKARVDLEFAKVYIKKGLALQIYHEIKPEHARSALFAGAIISSTIVVWQELDKERSGKFVVNFSMEPKHWAKGWVQTETLSKFAMSLQTNDHMQSSDIEKGFRHTRLHLLIQYRFSFRYKGRYYQCVAMFFGCGSSSLSLTRLMSLYCARAGVIRLLGAAIHKRFALSASPVWGDIDQGGLSASHRVL